MVFRRLTVPRADNFQVNLSVVLRFYRDAVHCMQRGLATRKLSVRLSVKRVDWVKLSRWSEIADFQSIVTRSASAVAPSKKF